MFEEVRSKQLQRYYDNKERYNEKAKKYFRSVWYVRNRDKVLQKQKEIRDSQPKKCKPKQPIPETNTSLIVSFD
jgi:hypothetical protein